MRRTFLTSILLFLLVSISNFSFGQYEGFWPQGSDTKYERRLAIIDTLFAHQVFIANNSQGNNSAVFKGASNAFLLYVDGPNDRIGLGTENPNTVLEIDASTSGVLIPRLTTLQRDAIAIPNTSELIYNTDEGEFRLGS